MNIGSALICIVSLFAGDEPVDSAKAEPAKHQGTWVATLMEREGQKTPADVVATITRVVEGDNVVWKRAGKPFAGTSVRLDPKADPKTIDVRPDGGPSRDTPVLGIYKLDGDDLTICMADAGATRPKEFSSPKGSKRTLMTFRRTAVAAKPQR
jgi:uncharacterized protein (TIGR03067 family)